MDHPLQSRGWVRERRHNSARARVVLAAAGVVFGGACGNTAAPQQQGHEFIVWAWERPEELSTLPPQVSVAFLARTLTLSTDAVHVQPRRNALRFAKGAQRIAVARIETARGQVPALSDAQLSRAAEVIAALGALNVSGVQIDFDATSSQRAFYRRLLHEVRARLPQDVSLTMTALASWCAQDPWLSDLPVDDAVPMLFRTGPDAPWLAQKLEGHVDFRAPECQRSVGVSTDEPLPWLPRRARTWVFHPRPWTAEDFHNVSEALAP